MTHSNNRPEVREFLRVVEAYKETFPTAVSIWGPVSAKGSLIDTMMAEHLATEVVAGRRGFATVGPPTKCSNPQQQPHINYIHNQSRTPLPNNPRSTSSDVWRMPAQEN